jgi:OmpA-OmpF porin, OOP family
MKVNPISRIVLGTFVGLLVAGSALAVEIITEEDLVQTVIQEEKLVRVADNAMFLLDASSSMNDKFGDTGQTQWQLMRKFLAERNSHFPAIGHKFGIYLYTPWKTVYPFGDYDRAAVAKALESLPEKGSGSTPLWTGMNELEKVLKTVSGHTAVFLFTDGTFTGGPTQRPIEVAERIVDDYDVCFYVISTAKKHENEMLLEKVGALNACSRVVPFTSFIDNPTYTTGALFDVKATESIVTTTEKRIVGLKVEDLTFHFDKAELRAEDKQKMEEVIRFLKAQPQAWVRIAGYTDNIGSKEANTTVSRRRAETLEQMLLNAGIDQSRIVTQWYGAANPIATNETEEGRALNRRIEIAIGM